MGLTKYCDVYTIDGNSKIHNRRRTNLNYEDTYTRLLRNVRSALQAGINVLIRVNVDKENYEHLDELWNDVKRINVYTAKIGVLLGKTGGSNASFTLSEFGEIEEEISKKLISSNLSEANLPICKGQWPKQRKADLYVNDQCKDICKQKIERAITQWMYQKNGRK